MNTTEHHEHDDVIEVTDLRRVYGGDRRERGDLGVGGAFEAVRGVSFSVGRGELFALLGTNGAGKTSTVELLEGLAAPVGGRVRVLGHDPYEERAVVWPRIGVMLQEGGFPSELTVAETVRMWAGCTSVARPTAEALESRAGATVRRAGGSSSWIGQSGAAVSGGAVRSAVRGLAVDRLQAFPCRVDHLFANRRHVRPEGERRGWFRLVEIITGWGGGIGHGEAGAGRVGA